MPLASELIERLGDPWARRELGRRLDELAGRGRVVERGVWLPAWTSLTVVGALTTTGRYTRLAHLVVVHVEVQGATSTASAVGTTYVNNLPFTALASAGALATDFSTGVGLANGQIVIATTRLYPPTWAASGDLFGLEAVYEAG